MARINVDERIVHCYIAYYGTGMSGKTTSLVQVHRHIPFDSKSGIDKAQNPHAVYFHCAHPYQIRNHQVFFHLRANSGAIIDTKARTAILDYADGVVFVVNSQRHKRKENLRALKEILSTLQLQQRDPRNFPIVIQYNKRDLPDVLSVGELDKDFNPFQWQRFETVATKGENVIETYNTICSKILAAL